MIPEENLVPDEAHAVGESVVATATVPPDSFVSATEQSDDLGSMRFPQALALFLEMRKPFLHPRTYRDYTYCSKWLNQYFGNFLPSDITGMHIRKYQIARKERCGPHMINHEGSLLQQLLKQCGMWERVGLGYQPLPLPKEGPGRAITEEEEHRLLRAGASNPQWISAYLFALISLNTTMGPGEIMKLRRKDIDLEKKTVSINPDGAKNTNRIRSIELNEIAFGACTEALAVAEKRGSILPEHYVFPYRHRRTHQYHPDRPCESFRKQWEKMLAFAGIEKLRMYDLRHTAITRLCEDPNVSEEVIESIAGHITHQMKKRYCHVRVEARRAALAGLVPARLDRSQMPSATPNGTQNGPAKTGKPMTNEHVLALVEAQLPAKIIVAKIERAPAAYDTAPETLKMLKQWGVPDAAILAMVKA
jgi:integrase